MYSFCAYFENFVTDEEIRRVINIDMMVLIAAIWLVSCI